MPVLASAWLNSLATETGTPTFLANFGSWAAPAIILAWEGDLLGMDYLNHRFGLEPSVWVGQQALEPRRLAVTLLRTRREARRILERSALSETHVLLELEEYKFQPLLKHLGMQAFGRESQR